MKFVNITSYFLVLYSLFSNSFFYSNLLKKENNEHLFFNNAKLGNETYNPIFPYLKNIQNSQELNNIKNNFNETKEEIYKNTTLLDINQFQHYLKIQPITNIIENNTQKNLSQKFYLKKLTNKFHENFTKENLDSNTINIDLKMNEIKKFSEENLFEEFLKKKIHKKKKVSEEEHVLIFYNSLSLIMLSMLGGGVVGIIFILYFSFKNNSDNENFAS